MRVAAEIELSGKDREQLGKWAAARSTPVRLRERARIVLLAAGGMTNKAIASELGIDANKVGRWRARVAAEGVSAIEKERPRGANHGGKDSRCCFPNYFIRRPTPSRSAGYAASATSVWIIA